VQLFWALTEAQLGRSFVETSWWIAECYCVENMQLEDFDDAVLEKFWR
jgi:hypothetical protein